MPYKFIKYWQSGLIDTIYYAYSPSGDLTSDSTISAYNSFSVTNNYTYFSNTVVRSQELISGIHGTANYIDTFHLTNSGNTINQVDTLYRSTADATLHEIFSTTVDSHPNPLFDKIPVPVAYINNNGWSDAPPEQKNNYTHVAQTSITFSGNYLALGNFSYTYTYNRFGNPASSIFYIGYAGTTYEWKAIYYYGQ